MISVLEAEKNSVHVHAPTSPYFSPLASLHTCSHVECVLWWCLYLCQGKIRRVVRTLHTENHVSLNGMLYGDVSVEVGGEETSNSELIRRGVVVDDFRRDPFSFSRNQHENRRNGGVH